MNADELVCEWLLADFRDWWGRASKEQREDQYYYVRHLAECPTTFAKPGTSDIDDRHSCAEGTCDFDPTAECVIACDHHKTSSYVWHVTAPTFSELLARLGAWASENGTF